MKIKHRRRSVKILIAGFFVLALAVTTIIALVQSSRTTAPKASHKISQKKSQTNQPPASSEFDKNLYSTTNPDSIWVVVNKQHALEPKTYQPSDLASVGGQQASAKITASLQQLITDAKMQGITLRVISGYRSYTYQNNLYNSYVAKDGQTVADSYSARPGYSEHQTGLAVDVGGTHGCDIEQCFGDTPEGKWLAENAHIYGFVIRYNDAKQHITGYQREPWHIRYVGVDLVKAMKKSQVTTLEEFFNVSGGTNYSD